MNAIQIERLLDRLAGYNTAVLAKTSTIRLFFCDMDVIYTYITGTASGRAVWANPLALAVPPADVSRVAAPTGAATELMEAIGQAVPRFLFGEFNTQLTAQLQRYYLTPEHHRELNAILRKVTEEAAAPSPPSLQEALRDNFLALGRSGLTAPQAREAVEQIFDLLGNSTSGAVIRGNDINRRYTTAHTTQMIRPPVGRAFIFSGDKLGETPRFSSALSEFFEANLRWLRDTRKESTQWLATLKRAVFENYLKHGPWRTVSDFVRELSVTPAARNAGPRVNVSRLIVMALRESADVVTLARLSTIAHELAERHPVDKWPWEICLIAGSARLAGIVDGLRRAESPAVEGLRIIHPLCFLRHPELYDPKGVAAVSEARARAGSDGAERSEYALAKIFGDRANGEPAANINAEWFLSSLTQALRGVVARVAEKDRSLEPLFKGTLALDDDYDPEALRESVRHLIARSFAETFVSLWELRSSDRSQAKPISIPILDLRRSDTAVEMFSQFRRIPRRPAPPTHVLRGRPPDTGPQSLMTREQFEKILQEDATGYCALLCAAVGYVARGRAWLQAAQTAASTAFMLAEGRTRKQEYPHGNSALYLLSFISRLSFDPRPRDGISAPVAVAEKVAAWYEQQCATINDALVRLDEWKTHVPGAALENIFGRRDVDMPAVPSYELTKLRYDGERLASRVFERLWLIAPPDAALSPELYRTTAELLTDVLAETSGHLQTWGKFDRTMSIPPPPSDSRSADSRDRFPLLLAFVGSELWKVGLQCWVLFDHCVSLLDPGTATAFRAAMAPHEAALAELLVRYKDAMGDEVSNVVRATYETFAIRRLGVRRHAWGVGESDFEVRLAAIDGIRFSFFLDRWREATADQR